MGQAKLRKQSDPHYGNPIPYTALLLDINNESLCEIPFCIPRQNNRHDTNVRAIANTGLIASFLQEQDSPDCRQRLAIALGDDSVAMLEDWLQKNPVNRFFLRLSGDYITQGNRENGRDVDDMPEFSTEAIYGTQYQMQPENLMSLAV